MRINAEGEKGGGEKVGFREGKRAKNEDERRGKSKFFFWRIFVVFSGKRAGVRREKQKMFGTGRMAPHGDGQKLEKSVEAT